MRATLHNNHTTNLTTHLTGTSIALRTHTASAVWIVLSLHFSPLAATESSSTPQAKRQSFDLLSTAPHTPIETCEYGNIGSSGKPVMDGESAEQREHRLKTLWRTLDTKRNGYLDLPALKTGLAQMNHRESAAVVISMLTSSRLMHTNLQRSKMQTVSSGICSRHATSITTGR